MSDFKTFLNEQLQDPQFRQWWEARLDLLVRQVDGNMTLSDMPLDEEDKARIRYVAEHPDEFDAILDQLIREHAVDVAHYEKAMAEYRENPVTYSHEQIFKMLDLSAAPTAPQMDDEKGMDTREG